MTFQNYKKMSLCVSVCIAFNSLTSKIFNSLGQILNFMILLRIAKLKDKSGQADVPPFSTKHGTQPKNELQHYNLA